MPRQSNSERLTKVHQVALRQNDAIQLGVRDERRQCLEDRRFYSIPRAQWEGDLGLQFENKPKIEVNKIHLSTIRIFNEYRNNRITVNFVSKDGSDKEQLADACNRLYRADEQDSVAEEAYDNAFEEAVGGGFGAWRLRAEYENEEDEEDERQRICIEPIYDADSCVFFDLNSKRQDKSDAKHCFVLSSMTPDAYEEEWGDSPSNWPKDIGSEFDWFTPDVVYVAEYYVVENVGETIVTFRLVDGSEIKHTKAELEESETLARTLESTGAEEIKRRKVKIEKVHKYIMSGGGVLEDCGYIAGRCIPIIPVFGKRWFVDGIERCMGHVRLSKDVQRLKNMQLSKLAEISALSSIEKPIFTPEQVSGHQNMWEEDNLKNYPFLLVNPITDAMGQQMVSGPIAYTKSPAIPPAMAALLQLTEQDMAEILGSSQQADKMVSNISGKAVELIQTRLDMQTFIYMSNMAKAVGRGGEVWLSMAKDVYPGSDKPRKMKGVGTQGDIGVIELMRPVLDKETGAIEFENDLSSAQMDVTVEVGPSSQSRKDATVRALTGILGITADPQTQQILQSMIFMNMEGEGMGDVREFFRKKLVAEGVVKPNDDDLKDMETAARNKPPDPETVLMQSMALNEQAKAMKAKADTVKSVADAEKTEAETAEILASMSIKGQNHALEVAQQMGSAVSGNQPTAPTAENTGASV